MKYKLFRSPGDLDKAVRKHELVAVETGKNIDDVADALIRAVRDDLAEMPEYAHCETAAYAPEPVQEHRRVRRYQYELMGIVYPQYAEKNILIDYGVIEEAEYQRDPQESKERMMQHLSSILPGVSAQQLTKILKG